MNKYELALVLNPTLDEETKAAEMTKVQELIERLMTGVREDSLMKSKK